MTELPHACPNCDTELDSSIVEPKKSDGEMTLKCLKCGHPLPTGDNDSVRVNYKSPVVTEDEDDG